MQRYVRRPTALVLAFPLFLFFITGCESIPFTEPVPASPTAAKSATPPVGDVSFQRFEAGAALLDVGVQVFDEGAGSASSNSYPTVRKAESLLLPVLLAQYLRESGAYGVVRVVPADGIYLPLQVAASIVRADGLELELDVEVRDAGNRTLLKKRYRDVTTPADFPVAKGDEPFADLYRAISNDLGTLVQDLDSSERQTLDRLALARFAAAISPAAFGRLVQVTQPRGGDSTVNQAFMLAGFPAAGGPMLGRMQRLRRQDALFIDSADEQYRLLLDEVQESYNLWREYNFELQRYGDAYREEASSRKSNARRGSYASMQQSYASFRKVKIQEEDLADLVDGFAGESLETVLRVDDGVFRLQGSVEQRYAQWKEILARINALETGIPKDS
ncbi:MAG: hypothetical protein AAF756_02555 [Pseudomonadota bacterium]